MRTSESEDGRRETGDGEDILGDGVGDGILETGDGRRGSGDGDQETGIRRWGSGDGDQETGIRERRGEMALDS